MPDTRCKWYGTDGTPLRGGCPVNGCRFIHPGQRSWDSALPSKVSVRCMFYDSNGERIHEGCRNRNCRFIHPNDPQWAVAIRSRLQPERRSNSSSSVPRSTQPNPAQSSRLSNDSTDACQPPTEVMRPSHIPSDPRISRPLKISTTDIASEVGADLTHASPSSPHVVSTPSRNSQPIAWQSSEVPSSALSENTDDHSRRMWKRRITLLTQAHHLVQKLSKIGTDVEQRIALHSNNSDIEALAGANLETLKDSARGAQTNLEGKLNLIISQLVEEDFWPLPTSKQSVTSVSRSQPQLSASLAELGRLLDTLETRLNKVTEMANSYQGHVSIVRAQEEGLPTSKRRRLSSKRSSQEPINFQEILGRLDCLQGKSIELEADKLFDGRLLEEIDERVDGRILEMPVMRPLQADTLKDAVQELDTDLDVLCNELAELDTTDIVSQIGTLRLETGNLKQTMESLASDQQSLQARQASLDQQTRKIMAELPQLQTLSQGLKCSVTTDCDKVVVEVKDEVQGHLDAEWAKLFGSIQSYHEEMKKNVFALLEPTVLKTETLYTHVISRTATRQH